MVTTRTIKLQKYFPEIQEFSHSKTNFAKPFFPHFEDKSWTSILYIERGNFHIQYESGEVLRAKGGTYYYHPPLSLKYQTYDKTITPYSMYHLAVDLSRTNLSLFSSHTGDKQILQQIPEYPFVRNAPALLVSSFKTIFQEFAAKQSGHLVQIENSIRQILISAIRSEQNQQQLEPTSAVFVKKIEEYLTDNPEFMGPVSILFELMGVSRSRGYTMFHQAFGINPKEYILRKKIVAAKKMLLNGQDVTSIAFELGFSSSQNFATIFKKLTCSTPSYFKKYHK